ncbi:MAG: hypothetical protein IJ067_08020 [Prevotella sp.]|nr:hypothetical protein [Prevotella sp.]
MKNKTFIVALALMLPATIAQAQVHIQKAFDALLNEKYDEIKTQHSLEKDPETGKKKGEMDVYDFQLPSPTGKQQQLIKDIQQAFEKDKEEAYSLHSGNSGDHASLAVGNGNSKSVGLGKIKGSRYIYACFLDKDDPEKKNRYAYAMEWTENDKKITVRLVKTYATIPRDWEFGKSSRRIIINGLDYDFPEISGDIMKPSPDNMWLSNFNTMRTLFLKKTEGPAANSYATHIYKLCKNADSLDEAEKKMVTAELLNMKNKTEDDFIRQLFDMSIQRLK